MNEQSKRVTELWKQWRAADTQLSRIAAASQRGATPPALEDLVQRCQQHTHVSRFRTAILKRLATSPAPR